MEDIKSKLIMIFIQYFKYSVIVKLHPALCNNNFTFNITTTTTTNSHYLKKMLLAINPHLFFLQICCCGWWWWCYQVVGVANITSRIKSCLIISQEEGEPPPPPPKSPAIYQTICTNKKVKKECNYLTQAFISRK